MRRRLSAPRCASWFGQAVFERREGSARRRRATKAVARCHRRVADLRREHLHQLTSDLAKNHGQVVIEDLNVRGISSRLEARSTGLGTT